MLKGVCPSSRPSVPVRIGLFFYRAPLLSKALGRPMTAVARPGDGAEHSRSADCELCCAELEHRHEDGDARLQLQGTVGLTSGLLGESERLTRGAVAVTYAKIAYDLISCS